MPKYNAGFIGSGNMGSALAKAAKKSNLNSIILADADLEKAKIVANNLSCQFGNNEETVKNSKFIFLGVKPQVLPKVLEEISPYLKERNDKYILVTMAAGVTIKSITDILGNAPIIRIMPNTPCAIGEGMILYCHNAMVEKEDEQEFLALLENAGAMDKIDESLIDAGSVVSGCGPAFVYMFIDALAEAGKECGLDKEKAIFYASKTLIGAANMVLQSDETPDKLRDNVCSPGGSTIEGVKSLQNDNLDELVKKALSASFKRTKELNI